MIKPVCGKWWNDEIKIFVNPTGKFEIGGPHGDAGVTGRRSLLIHTEVLGAMVEVLFLAKILQKWTDRRATCAGI